MTKTNPLLFGALTGGLGITVAALLALALPAVLGDQPSISDVTSNKNATAASGTITQNWAQGQTVRPGISQVETAACKSTEAVIGGGYQISGPDGAVLFAGPSLHLNAYAVQLLNHGDSTMEIQVYAVCKS